MSSNPEFVLDLVREENASIDFPRANQENIRRRKEAETKGSAEELSSFDGEINPEIDSEKKEAPDQKQTNQYGIEFRNALTNSKNYGDLLAIGFATGGTLAGFDSAIVTAIFTLGGIAYGGIAENHAWKTRKPIVDAIQLMLHNFGVEYEEWEAPILSDTGKIISAGFFMIFILIVFLFQKKQLLQFLEPWQQLYFH